MTISPIFRKLHQDGIATGFQSLSDFVVSVIKEPNSHGTLNLLSDPISVNDACLQNKVIYEGVQVNLCQKHLLFLDQLLNPQYDKRLFIDLPVQYIKTTSSEHVVIYQFST